MFWILMSIKNEKKKKDAVSNTIIAFKMISTHIAYGIGGGKFE